MGATMDEANSPLSGKGDANISRFLKACFSEVVDPSTQNSDAAMTTLMNHYLEQPVITDSQVAQKPASVLAHVYREVSSRAGRSVKKCLLDPDTPVSVLTEIKERYQGAAKRCQSEADRHVATVVYFGAIAGALVSHRERITSYSRHDLRKAINKLLDKPWVDPEIKGLLEQASKALEERPDTHGASPTAR
jgi:hypothetical protein